MNYWLDLFTGTTWKEFLDSGARVSGFTHRQRNIVSRIQKGDVLLCYMTGVMRWVGALEVVGKSADKSRIWKDAEFPERLDVKPLVMLQPEHGVPMDDLLGKVDFYSSKALAGKFKGFVRASPRKFTVQADGELILKLLKEAQAAPVSRPVDPAKLARKPRGFSVQVKQGGKQVQTVVTVPEPEPELTESVAAGDAYEAEVSAATRHTEIQATLLSLGAAMGLQVWVASNDRSRLFNGKKLSEFPGVVNQLPTQFNAATTRTIELIDVLWLKGNAIVAAFEVEATTSVYSGLLRMSDLIALQPNIDINLYLVAPAERRDKVAKEIWRPTFSRLEKPLPKVCGFLTFDKLRERAAMVLEHDLASSLQPGFVEKMAEYFEAEADE